MEKETEHSWTTRFLLPGKMENSIIHHSNWYSLSSYLELMCPCATFLDLFWSTHPLDGLKGNVSTSLVDEHQLPARVSNQATEKKYIYLPPALTRFLVMNEGIKHNNWLVKIPPDGRIALARKCNKTQTLQIDFVTRFAAPLLGIILLNLALLPKICSSLPWVHPHHETSHRFPFVPHGTYSATCSSAFYLSLFGQLAALPTPQPSRGTKYWATPTEVQRCCRFQI